MLNLRQVLYRAYTLSKVLFDNFTDIQNFVNNLQSQINGILTPPAGSEVPNARDFYPVLRDRLRGGFSATQNTLISGGAVTVNTNVAKVDIAPFEAIVNGVGCISTITQTSGTVPPCSAGNHRIDVVVINSDNSVSIISGAQSLLASTDPVFPVPSSTQVSLEALYINDASVNITGKLWKLSEDVRYKQNRYIKQPQTLFQGNYYLNNLIIDASVTLNCVSTSNFRNINIQFIRFSCSGNVYTTSNGTISIDTNNQIKNYFDNGGDGAGANGGGGGGASSMANGGHGGNAAAGSGGIMTTLNTSNGPAQNFSPGRGGNGRGSSPTLPSTQNAILFIVEARNISVSSNISNFGGSGNPSVSGTTGGSGGNAGGHTFLLAKENLFLGSLAINNSGGDGGSGSSTGGSGGGGGGGLIVERSLTYTSSASYITSGGAAGSNSSSTPATAGGNGLHDQKLIDDQSSFDNVLEFFNGVL